MAKAYIGTSGWNYRHWSNGKFYPENLRSADWLSFFVRHFHTVEINDSFYRLPSEVAFQNWRIQVPPGFIFSVKASRFLTHIKLVSAGTGTRKRAAHSATRPNFARHS
jgi:uncharacterized protein YecE (DUF72 family)